MALRLSAALRNALNESQSFKHAMSNCVMKWYTGSQPATAEAAPTGTLLVTISATSGAVTKEVLAQGTVTLNSGGSGSLDTLTVDGKEIMGSATAFNTSLTQTATDVATKINNNPKNQLFTASASGPVITLTAKRGLGTLPNGWVVASTATTIAKTDVNIGTATAGVAAVNGLTWDDSVAGVIPKTPSQTWSGLAAASGVPGWFRIESSVADAGGVDASESIFRIDGSIGSSGAELNMGTLSVTSGITQTVDTFTVSLPTA